MKLDYFWLIIDSKFVLTGLIIFVTLLLIQWRNTLRVLYYTTGRDLNAFFILLNVRIKLKKWQKNNETIASVFKKVVIEQPDKIAIYYEDDAWTFQQLDQFANQVANCFQNLGYKCGDVVAIFMDSKPEFVATWLGLSKIGVVSSLINTNLKLDTLIHSITTVNSRSLIFGGKQKEEVKQIISALNNNRSIDYFCMDEIDEEKEDPFRPLKSLLNLSCGTDFQLSYKGNFTDRLFYIYTSGTTGMPKAAIIKQSRVLLAGLGPHFIMNIKKSDVLYIPLPLYHFNGGIMGVGQCLLFGTTIAVRSKFSASNYWNDCKKYNCTIAQYIGELCRYLLLQPEKEIDQTHPVKQVMGNGLRPQFFSKFKERFNIDRVIEVYGSTEGNAFMANTDNRTGACGFIPRIIPQWLATRVLPVAIIKVDENNEPVRTDDGRCIQCEPDEIGMLIGIINNSDPFKHFDGYASKMDTDKKIIRHVFKDNDAAFMTGDLMYMDDLGYIYFMDRTGDTFRWKGENVSTTEVEGIISKVTKLADCIVFGVEVPSTEGKAGMAVICDPNHTLDLNQLYQDLAAMLPSYSIPIFIRFVNKFEMTSTLKLPKVALRDEGYDPRKVEDPLFVLDIKEKKYIELTGQVYDNIIDSLFKV